MKQYNKIIYAMMKNRNKTTWTAKDFQKGENFVGYEATARMSELAKMYPELFIVGKEGRFRTLQINWDCEYIQELEDMIEGIPPLNEYM